MGSMDERVLVVPTAELDQLGKFQGFRGDPERYLARLLCPETARFLRRGDAENDPTFKQIIPYVVIRSGDMVFCYTRGTSQGEARLHKRRSLGVGGHVDEADADGRTTRSAFESALERELAEEVRINSPGIIRCVGLINDDATPVGQVHLGLVHLYELDHPDVRPRESGLHDCEFLAVHELRDHWDEFESWSQICIDAFLDAKPLQTLT